MSGLDDNPTVLKVRQHLVEFLGAPDEVFELAGSPVPGSAMSALNLAYFAPQGPQAPVVFSTCGASLLQTADGRRNEGLVLLRKEPPPPVFDGVQRLLAQFALFPERSPNPVQLGDVVRAKEMLRPICGMDAVLFMPPVPFVPAFHRAAIGPQQFVDFVWLLPVFEDEAEYAMQHGPQALMMLFAAQGVDLTDLQRTEADTTMDPAEAEVRAQEATQRAQERAKNQSPRPSAGKPKSSRRDAPRGSFEAEDAGPTLRITRRGAGPNPEPTSASRPGSSVPGGGPGPRPGSQRPAPRARIAVRAPSKKEEIRFDLSAKAPPGQGLSPAKRSPAPSPRPKREAPPTLTEEQKAEAKARRIEALKQAAREAAERAAIRHSGQGQSRAPAPPVVAAQGDRTAVRAATKRRMGLRSTVSSDEEDTEQG